MARAGRDAVTVMSALVVFHQDHPGADGERCRDGLLLQHKEEPSERQTGAAQTRSVR